MDVDTEPRSTTPTLRERLLRKVAIKEKGCWYYTGARTLGYGRLWKDGQQDYAHRIAYELFVGPIPKGLEIDHLCRNRGCVNPAHLEAVPRKINAYRRHLDICKNGHKYDEANTRTSANGRRVCRACAREWAKKHYIPRSGK